MLITTIPWHVAGLMGQPRRVATFDYADPLMARMGPLVIMSVIGGVILLSSAILLIFILARTHFGARAETEPLGLRDCREPAAAVTAVTQRLCPLERDRGGADDPRLRLSDRTVLLSQAAFGSGSRGHDPVRFQRAT